jgi:RND superfamily putative drug exporter
LGLGIDYALFIVSRFREQLAAGQPVPVAVAHTVATAGRTVIYTAVAVMAALAALLVFPLYFLRSFGYAGIGVVAVAALGALVLLPALLAVLGPRVNAGRVPWTRATQGAASPWWGRLAGRVTRRPALFALPVIALLLLAASPLLGVSFGTPDQGVLRSTSDSRRVADALVTDFPGNASAPIDIVTTGPVGPVPLAAYARALSQLPDVASVSSSAGTFHGGQSQPGLPALGNATGERLTVVTTLAAKTERGQQLVRDIRAMAGPGGTDVLVTGVDAQLIDTRHIIAERLPLAAALIILTTLIVLFLFTGSVIQPIRAVLVNALSLGATLGVLTWIFQEGHLAGLVGRHAAPDGHVHDRAAVLHHVRALDGLRGLRAEPDQGDARPGRRSRHRGVGRPGPHRPDRLHGGRVAGGELLRLRHQHRELPADVRHRHRAGHPHRRHAHPRRAGAGGDAGARPGRVVLAGSAAPGVRAGGPQRDLTRFC